jgi:hypothetical protein
MAMRRKVESFFQWDGRRQHYRHGGDEGWLPLFYHRNETFASLHRASFDAVAAAIPTDDLVPCRWADGSALVLVQALRYHEVTWESPDGAQGQMMPYGEVAVAAAATRGPAARVLPLLRPLLSGFVLQLPVTSRQARDGGRDVFGFPKFVADMDFTEAPDSRQVRLSEGGRDILRLAVSTGGPVVSDRRPMVLYSAKDEELWEAVAPVLGHVQARVGRRAGRLELGDHDVARSLQALDVSASPLAVFNYLDHRSILPAPVRTGSAARPYPAFPGRDDDLARYTVRYPGTPALDQYPTTQRAPA